MKYLLTIAILLIATSGFAVDLATYTVCESGCDYTSVQGAENAHDQDLVANDSAITIEIRNTWVSSGVLWVVDGSTTDATRFMTFTAVGAARAGATWSTTAYRAKDFANLITISDGFVVVDGIQVENTNTNGIAVLVQGGGSNLTVKNCFLRGDGTTTGQRVIVVNNASLTGIIIRNNIIMDASVGAGVGIEIVGAATDGVTADNNTIENCADGIITTSGDTQVRNNLLWFCGFQFVGDFSELSEENWTDDVEFDYGSCSDCGTGDQVSQSDPFVNLAGEDYHLAPGATAINTGKDLSGDFTDAIGGKTRDANFDKGADEFIIITTLEGVTLEGVTIE